MATNQPQTTVLELPHTLTSDEKLVHRDRIMRVMDEQDDLEGEKAAATAKFKSREKDLAATLKKLRSESKVGVEIRKYRCNISRNIETQQVEYSVIDGPRAGEIVKTTPFEQEDWAAVSEAAQMDFDFPENPDAPDENDLRQRASLTDEPALTPNVDEMGNVVAGPDTDAYNMAHRDSPYQHLSEVIDFKPAVIQPAGEQAQDEAAEPTDAADVDRDDEHDLGTPHDAAAESDDDTDDDEPSDDDEPQPKQPKVPKRPANRRK